MFAAAGPRCRAGRPALCRGLTSIPQKGLQKCNKPAVQRYSLVSNRGDVNRDARDARYVVRDAMPAMQAQAMRAMRGMHMHDARAPRVQAERADPPRGRDARDGSYRLVG